MLISTNKKNNIAKSIALMLALVLAFSCILTACADKTARKDVEDLKATVDTLGKDVDTVEGVANAAVTNDALTKALADALAKYVKAEDLETLIAEYEKKGDAHKFVTDLLAGYYTKEDIDDMLEGYYNKEAVDTLVNTLVKKEDLPEFIVEFFNSDDSDDVKAALVELLEDTYLNKEDWAEATADVLTALSNLNKITQAVSASIFTVEEYAAYVELVEKTFQEDLGLADFTLDNIAKDAASGQLYYEIIRAYDTTKFVVIAELVDTLETLHSAADDIKAINDKIDALLNKKDAEGNAIGIDTHDKDALAAIKADIVAFDVKYGFNLEAKRVTVETATGAFETAFKGTAADSLTGADLEAKLVVNASYVPAGSTDPVKYATNADYVTYGGLKLAAYVTMQTTYDQLVADADTIDAKIVDLVADIQDNQNPDAAQCAKIEVVVALVRDTTDSAGVVTAKGFVSRNNGFTDEIEGYETFLYYEWLLGKVTFDSDKAEAKIALAAYASELEALHDSATMNANIARVVVKAQEDIEALSYAALKTPANADKALKDIVETAKKDMYEIYAAAALAEAKLALAAEFEAKKSATITFEDTNTTTIATDDRYDAVEKLIDEKIAAVEAIVAGEVTEEVKYPNTVALDAVKTLKTEGTAAIALATDKVTAKIDLTNYAKSYLKGGAKYDTTFKTFEDADGKITSYNEIEAVILADADEAYTTLVDVATTAADVATKKAEAKTAIDESAYGQLLVLKKAAVQAEIYKLLNDAKATDFDKVVELSTVAVKAVIAVDDVTMALTETVTTWDAAYTAAAADVDKVYKVEDDPATPEDEKGGFYYDTVVQAYLTFISTP